MLPASPAVTRLIAAAEPALHVAHAVVHHLREESQQVEIEHAEWSSPPRHLRFHAITSARPIK